MAKYIHVCKNCNKEFYDYFKNTGFCSRDCFNKYKKENSVCKTIVCPICNRKFQQKVKTQIFCSVDCRAKNTQNRIECVCDNCGKVFERKNSEVEKNKQHFCSNECRLNANWDIEDTLKLVDNYGKMSYKEMVDNRIFKKKRTISNISTRAIYIGITSSREWTKDEVDYLVNNYSIFSMKIITEHLSNRTMPSILGKARKLGLKSKFYIEHNYAKEKNDYLRNNYLTMTNEELALVLNRTPSAINEHLYVLDLHRPTEIDNYKTLKNYVRCRLKPWTELTRKKFGYKCQLSGENSNLVIHHIRGFINIFMETVDILDIVQYDDIAQYTQNELDRFMSKFLELQEFYSEYTCITEKVHKQFHSIYGYGYNTKEQWDEFVSNYY